MNKERLEDYIQVYTITGCEIAVSNDFYCKGFKPTTQNQSEGE